MLTKHFIEKLRARIYRIYKTDILEALFDELLSTIETVRRSSGTKSDKWSEKDCFLITYGDSILARNNRPLNTLKTFLDRYIGSTISHVHILPFFPYSSDDGFSVIDYFSVNPELGTWDDISSIGETYNLMFDLVINHISQNSLWFQNYLKGDEPGKNYFIETDPTQDLSAVVRPRNLPLLTAFTTINGTKQLWTTFSSDQIDLNFGNPEVLIGMMKIFLFYLSRGANVIRLDAVAFLWKEVGTSCLHRPETHEIVKLMRDIKDFIDPHAILITETNVPNAENLSYFNQGNEADMVYQFSLPPLLLHALFRGTSIHLNEWAKGIRNIPPGCTFFNFTASHDGIGLRPLEGLLSTREILNLAEGMKKSGAYISTRQNSEGTESPYEVNITYFDALKNIASGLDNYQTERFICSQTIMLALQGVPAFYIHSLMGTSNDYDGVKATGMPRSINRHKWNADELIQLLETETINAVILKELIRRIKIRKQEKAFHPEALQAVIDINDAVFAFNRGENDELTVIANLTPEIKKIKLSGSENNGILYFDLLSECSIHSGNIVLKPYQVIWLKK
jgi:sucrose phosphorylase